MSVHAGCDLSRSSVPASPHRITLKELSDPATIQAVAYWDALRSSRQFPSRQALSIRRMAPFLRHVALIEVLDGGGDYRFRLVGDAHVEARGADFSGETIREIAVRAPLFAERSHALYDYIRMTGEPYAVRGPMAANDANWCITYRECVFLPLGAQDNLVDFILAISVYTYQAPALSVYASEFVHRGHSDRRCGA